MTTARAVSTGNPWEKSLLVPRGIDMQFYKDHRVVQQPLSNASAPAPLDMTVDTYLEQRRPPLRRHTHRIEQDAKMRHRPLAVPELELPEPVAAVISIRACQYKRIARLTCTSYRAAGSSCAAVGGACVEELHLAWVWQADAGNEARCARD